MNDSKESAHPKSVLERKTRFLVLSGLFPPNVIGGAEMSAYNLAQWLRGQGFDVGVLTAAKSRDEVCAGIEVNGLTTWRVWMPRPYPLFKFQTASKWLKPIWHAQDHLDPRNRRIVAEVLDQFKPDIVNIHVLQGIGYNALHEIARRRIPTVYFLHDLGLACIRMSMFKNDRNCLTQCALCKISCAWKKRLVKKVPVLGFCSPSQANLDTLAPFFPVEQWPHAAIMNVNRYPAATVARQESGQVRFLYAGRLHSSKGVDVLLEAAQRLAQTHSFTMTVAGSGPDEAALRGKYGHLPWCRFTGFIPQQELANHMVNSDVFCIPSIWAENSPGVVIQALGLGLPVIGSRAGGIPELVEHGKNGLLAEPGNVEAWHQALSAAADNPAQRNAWREYALAHAGKFDQDFLGKKILAFFARLERFPKR